MSEEIKKILPVIFLIAAAGLGWLSWQGYQGVLIIQNQIKDSEDKTASLASASEKAANFAAFAKENPAVSEKLDIFLPDNSNKPGMISVLANTASASGLLLKDIKFTDLREMQVVEELTAPSAEEKPSTLDINLVFSGTYSSLKNFLLSMEKSLKFVDIVSIDFGSAENGQDKTQIASYDFAVGLKTYFMVKSDNLSKEKKSLMANNLADLSFAKENKFTSLAFPQNYDIDTVDTGDWGNKNIF